MYIRFSNRRKIRVYTAGSFLFDTFMVIFTGGLWLIWIISREVHK